jgi:hypothetical protein
MENALMDIPSCSFSSVKEWECKTNDDLLTLINQKFPLPHQASWTVFHFNTKMTTPVIFALQMKGITLAECQQLPGLEDTLGQSDKICPTSGVGPFPTGGVVHNKSACPHRVRSKSPQTTLWKGEVRCDWNNCWRSHGRRLRWPVGKTPQK